ncbi:unnamed protein product [Rotaria sordida]|uniref:Uncharacterized protein n=1 Tax=Rotaria sordida TaxID=392033 RepID=A0A814DKJ6_9BILA|nr:unnamed protein product [Rotaria sordida]CAF0955356.1 unnamed protein product [Rotaria sordida]
MHLLTLSILLLIGTHMVIATATECYECELTSACNDPFNANEFGVNKISSLSGWCYKVKGEEEGTYLIIRGADDVSCSKTGCDNVNGATICCCDTNLCNAARRSTSMITVIILAWSLAIGFARWFY